jgi:hypothetical protein
LLTKSTLLKALQYVDTLNAYGGTEILSALETVFTCPSRQDYPRSIFLLTDGSVSNTNACCDFIAGELKAAKRHQSTRVFTLGMGNDCSRALVNGIAEAGKGVSAYVEDEDSGTKSTVIRLLQRASQASFNEISIEWFTGEGNRVSVAGVNANLVEGSGNSSGFVERKQVRSLLGKRKPVSQAAQAQTSNIVYNKKCAHQVPNVPPPIYDGEHFLMYCRMPETGVHLTHCVVRAVQSGGITFEARIDVSEATVYDGDAIHRLSARALVRDIENGKGVWGDVSEKERKLEAVRLGVKYRIAGKYTSFIAVDKKQETDVSTYHEANLHAPAYPKANIRASPHPPAYQGRLHKPSERERSKKGKKMLGFAPPPPGAFAPPPPGAFAPPPPGAFAPPPPGAGAPSGAFRRGGGGGPLLRSMRASAPARSADYGAASVSTSKSAAFASKSDELIRHHRRASISSDSEDDDSSDFELEEETEALSKEKFDDSIAINRQQQQQQQQENNNNKQHKSFDEDLIISMQELDGSFDVASTIDRLSHAASSKNLGTACACPVSCENVTLWWTLVIIAMFKLIRVDTEDEWTMIIAKSERWVSKTSKQQDYNALGEWKRLANEGVKTAFGLKK